MQYRFDHLPVLVTHGSIADMDVTRTRALNIAMLVEQSGGPTAFGKLIDRDQVQVSQWTSAKKPKPIGGRLARYIEGRLGRERGWLDRPQWEAETAMPSASQSVRLDAEMILDVVQSLQHVFAEIGLVYSVEDEPGLFAEFLEDRIAMRDIRSVEAKAKVGKWLKRGTQGDVDERASQVPSEGTHKGKTGGGHAKG